MSNIAYFIQLLEDRGFDLIGGKDGNVELSFDEGGITFSVEEKNIANINFDELEITANNLKNSYLKFFDRNGKPLKR